MSTDKDATPGLIVPIVLIPLVLIFSVALSILKGFNLLPPGGSWGSWLACFFSRLKPRPHIQYPANEASRDTVGSFSTIESSFIGQSNNEANQVVSKPHVVHYASRLRQWDSDGWNSRPLSRTSPYCQEGQV